MVERGEKENAYCTCLYLFCIITEPMPGGIFFRETNDPDRQVCSHTIIKIIRLHCCCAVFLFSFQLLDNEIIMMEEGKNV